MTLFAKTLFLFGQLKLDILKLDNLIKTDHFFPAFLHQEAAYSPKIKVQSILSSTVSTSHFP